MPDFQGCSGGRAKRACMRSSLGFGDLSVIGMQSNSTLGLSTCSFLKAWLMGVQIWKHRAYCCMSWWACTLVELPQAFRRRKPQRGACRVARVLSVGWFRLIQDLDTSLVVFLRGTCSGLAPPEGGFVYGLFSKEALYIGKASVNRTHSPGLAAHLTEHNPVSASSWSQRIDFSGASYGAFVSFHWLSVPPPLKP